MSKHLCREIRFRLTTLFGQESDRLVYIRPQVQAFSRLVCWLFLYRNLGVLSTDLKYFCFLPINAIKQAVFTIRLFGITKRRLPGQRSQPTLAIAYPPQARLRWAV
jgi:hypothetical protein